MSDYANSIEERLNRHPILKNRVESLLNIVENSSGDASTADDAEKRVVQELRQMGNEKWEMGNGKWEMGNGKWEMKC